MSSRTPNPTIDRLLDVPGHGPLRVRDIPGPHDNALSESLDPIAFSYGATDLVFSGPTPEVETSLRFALDGSLELSAPAAMRGPRCPAAGALRRPA